MASENRRAFAQEASTDAELVGIGGKKAGWRLPALRPVSHIDELESRRRVWITENKDDHQKSLAATTARSRAGNAAKPWPRRLAAASCSSGLIVCKPGK